MITVIADDKIPFLKGALEPYASVRYMDGREIDAAAVKHADALLVRTRTHCNKALLAGSNVKFIATATIGFDHIDTGFCDENSIEWVNAPGCNAASVQQYIASVLANMATRHGFPLAGKTIGIIGAGHVGRRIESLASLLGLKVLLNDPPRARNEGSAGFVSLEKLLSDSDIVTLHVPLNKTGRDQTHHMINEDSIRILRDGAWLINSARGEVVNGKHLRAALSAGKFSGVALDVWENEPSVDLQLLKKVVIATPHIAGYSTDGKRNGTVQVVRDFGRFFGFPLSEWEPVDIPAPLLTVISVDCQDQSMEKILCTVILQTYNVTEDDVRFRSHPADFEMQRGNYPVRREFPAYEIRLVNPREGIREAFSALGFRVV
ncbi:MAG: 4-phosphoerythronate dehydrogenase PdxB [Bacteroidales bacterium]